MVFLTCGDRLVECATQHSPNIRFALALAQSASRRVGHFDSNRAAASPRLFEAPSSAGARSETGQYRYAPDSPASALSSCAM
jgi:adenosine/AMP kinase